MNSLFRNVLLFFAVLVLSYLTAPYFGGWYDHIDYQYGGWMTSKKDAVNFIGMFLSFLFFTPLLFKLFGHGNRNKIILWLLIPLILFFTAYNLQLVYIPIILSLIGFGLATLINKLFKPKVIS